MAIINETLRGISETLEGIDDQLENKTKHLESYNKEIAETLRVTNRELTYIGEGVRKLS